jgi:hypothetical protein
LRSRRADGSTESCASQADEGWLVCTIVESQPLFAFGWRASLAPLGALVLLVPVAALAAVARGGDARRALALVALGTLVATLQQRRFMHLAALPEAIILCDAGVCLARDRRRTALVAGAAALGWLPCAGYFLDRPEEASPRQRAVRQLADRLARLPTGGVLAQWPYGHLITRFGHQPVMASPLLTPRTEPAPGAASRIRRED